MRCAVLGDPIAHSLSPVLHRAGYVAVGLDWSYDAVQVRSGDLAGFVDGLGGPEGGWRGLSVTAPLKREALARADVVSARAELVGSANTLLLTGQQVHADNTDLPGAVAAVRERYDGTIRHATILGGGATAAATGLAMVDLGASTVLVAVRRPERAREAAERIAAHPSGPRVDVVGLDDASDDTDAIVSTIPVSAQTERLAAACAGVPLMFDVVYDPWPTPLSAVGSVVVSGLDLLVHQAALQFTAFTGLAAPLAEMRAAGEAALRERVS
ncbi:shikimate dehydrogenase [Nocardioides sp. MH1]|uniref:shikimate dehydrogenase n=1 Tax=Nocardioides sp. MH1 TaxID=3242490 RepID=UPI0035213001